MRSSELLSRDVGSVQLSLSRDLIITTPAHSTDKMISNIVTLISLLLLVSLVTPDPVAQYVQDTRDLNLADTEDTEDRSPVLQAMDTAQFVLRTAWDFVEEEARTVLDRERILGGVRLASLSIMGLYILSSMTGLIVPVIIFMSIYSFPSDFFQNDV